MLQFGYIALTVLMISIILLGYFRTLQKTTTIELSRKRTLKVGIGLLLWILYTSIIAKTGFLQDYSLPPRFPILLIIPAFTFTGFFLYKHRNSSVIKNIPTSWLVYYQSFRILIESLFVASVAKGLLQPEVTFEGYNYDILFGLSALIIGFLAFNKKVISGKGLLLWNYLGLAVIAFIIFLFTTTTYAPELWGSTETLATKEMVTFPFVFVPAFLMPSAIFMHVVSIIQLRKKLKL
jgi:hypothetical protein